MKTNTICVQLIWKPVWPYSVFYMFENSDHFLFPWVERRIVFKKSICISSPAAFLFYTFIRNLACSLWSMGSPCAWGGGGEPARPRSCVCKDDFSSIMFLNLTRSYKLVKKKKKQRVIKRGKITEPRWNGSLSALVLIQSVSKGSFVMPLPQHTNLLDQVCQNIDWKQRTTGAAFVLRAAGSLCVKQDYQGVMKRVKGCPSLPSWQCDGAGARVWLRRGRRGQSADRVWNTRMQISLAAVNHIFLMKNSIAGQTNIETAACS